jgi:hypothetical protein
LYSPSAKRLCLRNISCRTSTFESCVRAGVSEWVSEKERETALKKRPFKIPPFPPKLTAHPGVWSRCNKRERESRDYSQRFGSGNAGSLAHYRMEMTQGPRTLLVTNLLSYRETRVVVPSGWVTVSRRFEGTCSLHLHSNEFTHNPEDDVRFFGTSESPSHTAQPLRHGPP